MKDAAISFGGALSAYLSYYANATVKWDVDEANKWIAAISGLLLILATILSIIHSLRVLLRKGVDQSGEDKAG